MSLVVITSLCLGRSVTDAGLRWKTSSKGDDDPNLVNTVRGYAIMKNKSSPMLLMLAPSLGAQHQRHRCKPIKLDSAWADFWPSRPTPAKADTSFIRLQDELAGTENRIATERMRFNESVQTWNTTIRQFPTNLLANLMGRQAKPFFEAAPSALEVPQVQF